MLKRAQIIQEYNFLTEAVPIALLGILLNVAGRQITGHFGFSFVFVDMIGTAFAALLIGPWWAAAAAAATTVVNGNFYESYFPFGVVNITGALVWGYMSRAAGLRSRMIDFEKGELRGTVYWTIALWLAGGVACGLASTGVKLILYPQLGRPFIFGAFYLQTQAQLDTALGLVTPHVVTLTLADLVRDLADKAIVVPAAVLLIGLCRIATTLRGTTAAAGLLERLRTDFVSIFVFVVVYSAYILLAQLMRPVISLSGGVREVAWLRSPEIVAMLYAPLVIAVLVFVFMTYRGSDAIARRIDSWRQFRGYVFRTLFGGGDGSSSLSRYQGLQPLSIGVSLWSLRSVIDERFGVPLALIAIFIAIATYVMVARLAYPRLRTAMEGTLTLHRWLALDRMPKAGGDLLTLLRGLFSDYISRAGTTLARRSDLLYVLAFATDAKPSWLAEALLGRRSNLLTERIAILAVVGGSGALTPQVARELDELAEETAAGLVAVVSTTPRPVESEVLERLRRMHQRRAELLLFDWTDIMLAIAARALQTTPGAAVQRARARILEALNSRGETVPTELQTRSEWLANRSLPSLRFIIERLPRRSRVFDLGAGYGRHTFAALAAGHDVVAVERKPAVRADLARDLAEAGYVADRVRLIEGDYLDAGPDEIGVARLVVATGVLQHATDAADLERRLSHIAQLADAPGAVVYIEMLFDMLFDEKPPSDGRIAIDRAAFEQMLRQTFSADSWKIDRTHGPARQKQSFANGMRSFEAPCSAIESTTVEYLLRRSS
jgi:SAM-dependent methyltransferase